MRAARSPITVVTDSRFVLFVLFAAADRAKTEAHAKLHKVLREHIAVAEEMGNAEEEKAYLQWLLEERQVEGERRELEWVEMPVELVALDWHTNDLIGLDE